MKLYEENIKFNTYEVLTFFVDLSKKRRQFCEDEDNELISCLVRFSLGRRAGHTTAIMDFLEHNFEGSHTFVVVPNTVIQSHYIENSYPSVYVSENDFRHHFGDRNTSPKIIIFDGIDSLSVSRFFLNSIIYYPDKVKAMVSVG